MFDKVSDNVRVCWVIRKQIFVSFFKIKLSLKFLSR